jgi:DNA-binding NtrC family response regulator
MRGKPVNTFSNDGQRPGVGRGHELVGTSPCFLAVLAKARARARGPVRQIFIAGESGTGKELLARYIHENSAQATGPFEIINCGALPESLLQSELFGHEKGAFTDAKDLREGVFMRADGGTIVLDEIGNLRRDHQAALLRVLDGNGFTRVGGVETHRPTFRLISATRRNLRALVEEGDFLEDLFYRLNAANPLCVPPLRERPEDIPLLATTFLVRTGAPQAPEGVWAPLIDYDWPGNVRQLYQFVEVLACQYRELSAACVKKALAEHDRHIPRPGPCRSERSQLNAAGAGPAPRPAQADADGARQNVINSLVLYLYSLPPDGRRRFVKGSIICEAFRDLLVAAVAQYCMERAGAENDRPLNVYRRHFDRRRLGQKSIKDISQFDQEIRRRLETT